MKMLEIDGLEHAYGRHPALRDVAIRVRGGEVVAILRRERRRQDDAPQRRRGPGAAVQRLDPVSRGRTCRPARPPHRRTGRRDGDGEPPSCSAPCR